MPDAVAGKRTEYGRRVEIIGYTIDLDSGLVTMTGKNFLKMHSMSFLECPSRSLSKKT